MPDRRFPSPWEIEDNGACFIVRDHSGQALAYLYYENEPGRRAAARAMRHGASPSTWPSYRRYSLALLVALARDRPTGLYRKIMTADARSLSVSAALDGRADMGDQR
jgi:hypothetical protein